MKRTRLKRLLSKKIEAALRSHSIDFVISEMGGHMKSVKFKKKSGFYYCKLKLRGYEKLRSRRGHSTPYSALREILTRVISDI